MSVQHRLPVEWLLWAVAVTVIAGSVVMIQANPYTTVLGTGAGWMWSAVGAAALAAAAAATRSRRRRIALALTALLWFVPDWAGWAAGSAWIRVAASASAAMLVVAAVAAAFELVGVTGRARTVVLWPIVVVASAISVLTLWFVDPFVDPECWRHCGHNPLLIADLRPDRAVEMAAWFVASMSAVAAVVVLCRLRTLATRAAGRFASLTGIGSAVLVVGVGAIGLVSDLAALVAAGAGSLLILAGLSSDRWHEWRMRVALGQLIEDLREPPVPGALADVLAARLGDPGLDVSFWSAARGEHVDAEGQPKRLTPSGNRAMTTVVRAGEPVAAIVHRLDLDPAALDRALRPAVRLWLNNDQIRASTLAELAELRASEARLADRTDEERRRLERNLHDGAQQRVVGIALLLRMLRARHGDLPASGAAVADRCAEMLDVLLDDLRRITDTDSRPHVAASAEEMI